MPGIRHQSETETEIGLLASPRTSPSQKFKAKSYSNDEKSNLASGLSAVLNVGLVPVDSSLVKLS